MTILFLHCWQSVPGDAKPTYLKDQGHTVINPKLPDEDFDESVKIAQAEFDKHQPEVVVGWSRGGAVAINIDSGDARLVMLGPAWKKWGTAKTIKADSYILHSRADGVVPFADSEELVQNSGLPKFTLIEVGSVHRLADPEPLVEQHRRIRAAVGLELEPCPVIFSQHIHYRCFQCRVIADELPIPVRCSRRF